MPDSAKIERQYNHGIICEHERDALLAGKIGDEVVCFVCHPGDVKCECGHRKDNHASSSQGRAHLYCCYTNCDCEDFVQKWTSFCSLEVPMELSGQEKELIRQSLNTEIAEIKIDIEKGVSPNGIFGRLELVRMLDGLEKLLKRFE